MIDNVLAGLIRIYRYCVSPFLGPGCRFSWALELAQKLGHSDEPIYQYCIHSRGHRCAAGGFVRIFQQVLFQPGLPGRAIWSDLGSTSEWQPFAERIDDRLAASDLVELGQYRRCHYSCRAANLDRAVGKNGWERVPVHREDPLEAF